jgi:hypothetical protein
MAFSFHCSWIYCIYNKLMAKGRNALLLFRITTLATVDSYPSNETELSNEIGFERTLFHSLKQAGLLVLLL